MDSQLNPGKIQKSTRNAKDLQTLAEEKEKLRRYLHLEGIQEKKFQDYQHALHSHSLNASFNSESNYTPSRISQYTTLVKRERDRAEHERIKNFMDFPKLKAKWHVNSDEQVKDSIRRVMMRENLMDAERLNAQQWAFRKKSNSNQKEFFLDFSSAIVAQTKEEIDNERQFKRNVIDNKEDPSILIKKELYGTAKSTNNKQRIKQKRSSLYTKRKTQMDYKAEKAKKEKESFCSMKQRDFDNTQKAIVSTRKYMDLFEGF